MQSWQTWIQNSRIISPRLEGDDGSIDRLGKVKRRRLIGAFLGGRTRTGWACTVLLLQELIMGSFYELTDDKRN